MAKGALQNISDEELQKAIGGQASPDVPPPTAALSDDELNRAIAQANPKHTQGQTAYAKFEEGAVMGARPFLSGLGDLIGTSVGTFQGLKDMPIGERLSHAAQEGGKAFNQTRHAVKADQELMAQEYPLTSGAANLSGMLLSAPLVAAKGVVGAAKLGTLGGALTAASESDTLGDAAGKIATGAVTGALVGKAGQNLGALGKGVQTGLASDVVPQFAVNAGKAVRSVLSIPKEASIKIGNLLSGVPEQEIRTYVNKTKEIDDLIKATGGNLPEAADRIRGTLEFNLRQTRKNLSGEISKALKEASPDKTIEIAPILKNLDVEAAKLNPKLRGAEVEQINELKNLINGASDNGHMSVGDLFDTKELLQERAAGSYLKGGQIFQPGKTSQQAAKGAAATARKILNQVSPEIAEANNKLANLHLIEKRLNKNLITPGNPDSALFAAGSGANSRNAKMLERLGKATGQDALGEAQKLTAARRFASPGLSTADATGKGVERLFKGGGLGALIGGGIAGPGGAAVGATIGSALTSPAALKVAIKAGRIPVSVVSRITGSAANLGEGAIKKLFETLQTKEGQALLLEELNKTEFSLPALIKRRIAGEQEKRI